MRSGYSQSCDYLEEEAHTHELAIASSLTTPLLSEILGYSRSVMTLAFQPLCWLSWIHAAKGALDPPLARLPPACCYIHQDLPECLRTFINALNIGLSHAFVYLDVCATIPSLGKLESLIFNPSSTRCCPASPSSSLSLCFSVFYVLTL